MLAITVIHLRSDGAKSHPFTYLLADRPLPNHPTVTNLLVVGAEGGSGVVQATFYNANGRNAVHPEHPAMVARAQVVSIALSDGSVVEVNPAGALAFVPPARPQSRVGRAFSCLPQPLHPLP